MTYRQWTDWTGLTVGITGSSSLNNTILSTPVIIMIWFSTAGIRTIQIP
jgi:hypothetical protein